MRHTGGFTLLEILIVVVIASSILAFALPAQKRAQNRNRYLAAQGVLMDVSAALQSYWDANGSASPSAAELADPGDEDGLYQALLDGGFLQPIPFDSGAVYKKYSFYFCPKSGSTAQCCSSGVVACMQGNTDFGCEYYGARMARNGAITKWEICPTN